MSQEDRFDDLWTDYLEGELDDEGVAELQHLLANDDLRLMQAADLFQMHRMLGLAAADEVDRQESFVRETMAQLPADGNSFVSGVMDQVTGAATCAARPTSLRRTTIVSAAAVAVLLLGVLVTWPFLAKQDGPVSLRDPVHLASLSHAKFFGELSPPVGSAMWPERDYVLLSGLVELAFPAGASAIIEGPAVFRVTSAESLALDVGRCSVHAPDGAEGFRVETPGTRVVDRGTRFSVNVSETSETEVQVIEGAADIYERQTMTGGAPEPASGETDKAIRLTANDAQRFAHVREFTSTAIPFDVGDYRRQLPNRVVSYEATTGADGDAEHLVSVTVQRAGVVSTIPVGDLIPADIAWFRGSAGAYLCSNQSLPPDRLQLLTDRSLVTGVINPGGSETPLTSDPIVDGDAGTPGMLIRFRSPVVNGPDADIVLFDLQTFVDPPEGDAFHVGPVKFRPGLRSHTIRVFDLTMESPSALNLTDFDVSMFGRPVESVSDLQTAECSPRRQVVKFRGLAVGIDLSDLGYGRGESVEELFLQDALDDQHYIDPVFIGGLPSPP